MPTLQKINLGTPPAGKDGESTRAGFVKMNANVDVLSMLVALGYALITDNTTLTPAQVGTRYGINIADPGKSIAIPLASSVSVNACLQFFNVGSAVTISTQGNDGTQIRTLNKGDWATYISDGVKYWHVAERGKMLSDEIVGGNLTVGGRVLVGGAADDGSTALQVKGAASIGKFLSRPTFGDNVPWDSGNLTSPLTTDAVQAIYAAGGDETDLINTDQVRLSTNFTPRASSIMATASLFFQTANASQSANDFICHLDIYDTVANRIIAAGNSNVLSVFDNSKYIGLASTGTMSCNIAFNGLTIGRVYQLRLLVRKNVLTGPIYPRGMHISGMVA